MPQSSPWPHLHRLSQQACPLLRPAWNALAGRKPEGLGGAGGSLWLSCPCALPRFPLRLYALFIWLSNLCVCFLHAWGLALPLRPARLCVLCGRSAIRSAARLNDGNNGQPASSLWGSRSLCRSLPRLFRLRIRCCPSVLCPRRLFGIRFLPQRGRRRSVRLVSRIFGRF